MEFQFLTLPKYAGQVITVEEEGGASMGGDQPNRWELVADPPTWMTDAVAGLFSARNDTLSGVYKLDYADINGLGNSIYCLDGEKERYCLKMLGKSPGNDRETLVWEILGYGEADKDDGNFQPIKGLPPQKLTFVDTQLRSVLTPYYEGVLKPISGGRYEMPLVLAAVLYLEETLTNLHQRGLAYMDLCPANILFKTLPTGSLLFFLADMGGVKPLRGYPTDDPRLEKLVDVVSVRRWTRRESLPPADLFPLDTAEPRVELTPGYDFHTLARTALVMMGLGLDSVVAEEELAAFPAGICMEDPMRPMRSEVQHMVTLLQPWLLGQSQDEKARGQMKEKLADLYRGFFTARAAFAGDQLTGTPLIDRWQKLLENRILRYRVALGLPGSQALHETCVAAMNGDGKATLNDDIERLNDLPECLKLQDMERCLNLLRELAASKLIQLSRTANYSWCYHRKLARCIWGSRAGLGDLGTPRSARPFEDEPEAATARALRRGTKPDELGILTRTL